MTNSENPDEIAVSSGFALFAKVSYWSVRMKGLIPSRKHAYSNILKLLPPKNENFRGKKSDIFHISAQNIDCGYSLEPPRKIMYTPINPSFAVLVGFKGMNII